MPIALGYAIASIAGPPILNGIMGAVNGRKDEKNAENERNNLEKTLQGLEQERIDIVNNFEGQFSNTYANLGVATQAAEIQIEQTDIALANTLDTIRATGGGAGGATALAQAALASKKGVSASIEKQEVANEKLRADGEAILQQKKLEEGLRAEGRIVEQLDRTQGLTDEQRAREMQGKIDKRAAFSTTMAGLGDAAGSLVGMAGIK